jgi:hypothetical protein
MSNEKVNVKNNIILQKASFSKLGGMKGKYKIIEGDQIISHNIVLDIGKSFLIRNLSGDFGLKSCVLRYVGIGRSAFPGGGSPAPSSSLLVSLSDPNPYYISITNYDLNASGEGAQLTYPTSVTFSIHIVGTPELFDHFEAGSGSLSIGELGLFFDTTDTEDPDWGANPTGKLPYTIFARDNILESVGNPIVLERSNTPGVYHAWICKWTVEMG